MLSVPAVAPKLPSMCSGGCGHGPSSHSPWDGLAPLASMPSESARVLRLAHRSTKALVLTIYWGLPAKY